MNLVLSISVSTLFAISSIFMLSADVQSYHDDFVSAPKDENTSYHSTMLVERVSGVYICSTGLPDETAISLPQSNIQDTAAIYKVTAAEDVTVGFYSKLGAHASFVNSNIKQGGSVSGGNYYPIKIGSPDEVFMTVERQNYRLEKVGFARKFVPCANIPTGLIDLGLNLYVSKNGTDFTRVSPSATTPPLAFANSATTIGAYYYENSYKIPTDINYIKVELNDYYGIPGDNSVTSVHPVMLANLEISGKSFKMGIAEVPEPPSTSSSESSSSESSSSESSSSGSSSGNPSEPIIGGGGNDLNTKPSPSSSSKPLKTSSSSRASSSKQPAKNPVTSSSSKENIAESRSDNYLPEQSDTEVGTTLTSKPNVTVIGSNPISKVPNSSVLLIAVALTSAGASAAGIITFMNYKKTLKVKPKDNLL